MRFDLGPGESIGGLSSDPDFNGQVRQICHIALKRDHEFINTVEEGEETHSQVGFFS